MYSPHISQASFFAFFKSILVGFLLFSQSYGQTLSDYARTLRKNTVTISASWSQGNRMINSEDGFGFITGESENSFFIITAFHVVAKHDRFNIDKEINVGFYDQGGRTVSARFLRGDNGLDLALLEVPKPTTELGWEKKCFSPSTVRGQLVTYIGKNGNFYVPSSREQGEIVSIEPSKINLSIDDILPGTSGAPIIGELGIVGMISKSEDGGAIGIQIQSIERFINQEAGQQNAFELKTVNRAPLAGIGLSAIGIGGLIFGLNEYNLAQEKYQVYVDFRYESDPVYADKERDQWFQEAKDQDNQARIAMIAGGVLVAAGAILIYRNRRKYKKRAPKYTNISIYPHYRPSPFGTQNLGLGILARF